MTQHGSVAEFRRHNHVTQSTASETRPKTELNSVIKCKACNIFGTCTRIGAFGVLRVEKDYDILLVYRLETADDTTRPSLDINGGHLCNLCSG